MDQSRKDKLQLINRYLYRTLVKMFTPGVSRDFEYLIEDLTESEESFGRKIDNAYEALQSTSRLVERLEGELSRKISDVERLKGEYERFSRLAEVEEAKARAIVKQLESTLDRGKAKERVLAFLINLAAGLILFVVGVIVGPYLTSWLGIGT